MRENEIQASIMLAVGSRPDTRLFWNTVGFGYQGEAVRLDGGDVLVKAARPVTFGLAPGSADQVGWRTVEVTPGMVGRRLAVFLSVEVKQARGRAAAEQRTWRQRVAEAGGIAGITRSAEEALALVEGI